MRLCKLAVYCALFVAACVPAFCQSGLRVNVPFDFMVGNRAFPAGEYGLRSTTINGTETWRITNDKGNSVYMLTNSADSPIVEHKPSLLFQRFGGRYTLAQFWTNTHSGRQVVIPNLPKNVIAQSEFTLIAAER